MPINTDLLIAAPMLQDFLIDKDGTPMSGGTITMYHDNSRTTLKNWYYQSGTPGNYTYVPLPNPLTLSAAGTICDINGVDTIPFYYPYDETDESIKDPYFVTIVNHAQTNQITRANFPFLSSSSAASTGTSLSNLIVNNGFWRNAQPNYANSASFTSIDLSSITNLIVAPSQHDGFSMPDIQFFKSNTNANDALTFTPFLATNDTVISKYVTPEYYINHHCTNPGAMGETFKYYQFPIALHLQNLANQPFTFSIQAQNEGGSGPDQNVLTINILTFTGSGTSSPTVTTIGTLTLNPSWTPYTITDIFPDITGLTLGNGEDDAFYLQIQVPMNVECNVNFTKPSIYLTTNVIAANDFQTYDEVNSIISSPRTGDVRITLNTFYNATTKWCYGWIPINGGTIGNSSSNATNRSNADTWPLFNLLWSNFSNFYAGGINLIAPLYTSTGVPSLYGSSAISDFNANKQLQITSTIGQVLMGTVPATAMLSTNATTFTVTNVGGFLQINAATNMNIYNGMPIVFTGGSLPATILPLHVYYVSALNGATSFFVSTTFANAMAGVFVGYAAGSGVVLASIAGSVGGEYSHTQLLNEMVNHLHDPLAPGNNFINAAAVGSANLAPAASPGVVGGATTGAVTNYTGQTAFNVTQPGVFYNMFIKL